MLEFTAKKTKDIWNPMAFGPFYGQHIHQI